MDQSSEHAGKDGRSGVAPPPLGRRVLPAGVNVCGVVASHGS